MAKTPAAAHLVAVELPSAPVEASPAASLVLPPLELAPERRSAWPTLAALAIACGLAAVGLGAWLVLSEARSTDELGPSSPAVEQSLRVLAESDAERYRLANSVGRIVLVVSQDGHAVLTLDGLGVAPGGSVYQAWLVPPGSATPRPAGTFDASERFVPLDLVVPPKALVGVTLEPAPGGNRPSRPLRLSAVRG